MFAVEDATTFAAGATISALVVELILARVSELMVKVSSDSIVIEVERGALLIAFLVELGRLSYISLSSSVLGFLIFSSS